ncbi:MAG: YoaK family protein [Streptosporangiaceae bacterium]
MKAPPDRPWPPAATEILVIVLTLTTGAVDATCVLHLGHVFGSVITGNLVLIGASAALPARVLAAAAVALGSYAAGVLVAAPIAREADRSDDDDSGRWPARVIVCLGLEFCLLAAFSAGWLAAGGRPGPQAGLGLLALAAAGLGMQSAAVRRLGPFSTTYLTSMLTGILAGRATWSWPDGWRRSVAILAALPTGAVIGAVTAANAPDLVPLVVLAPLAAVAGAALVLRRRASEPGPGQPYLRPPWPAVGSSCGGGFAGQADHAWGGEHAGCCMKPGFDTRKR